MRIHVEQRVSADALSRCYQVGEQLAPDEDALWMIEHGIARSLEPPPDPESAAGVQPPKTKKRRAGA